MTQVVEPRETALDYHAIKLRQQASWASVDSAVIGTTLQIVGETLAEAVDIRSGECVLDVAAGNGNATLAAARRFAAVTSTDYVPTLLQKGRDRARAEALDVVFQVADAEQLPFADGSFDVVLSTFGCMFAPDQPRVAAELMRVVRRAGRIGMANWTPDGFVGRLLRLVGAFVPAPAGVAAPVSWGTEAHIEEMFGAHALRIACARRVFRFRYRSAAHWLQVFRDFYGPVHTAFAALDHQGRRSLERDILILLGHFNAGFEDALVVPGEYLEVVITKA